MEIELQRLYNKIVNKENFALVRFGDGEHNILQNVPCNRNGFDYDPGDIRDQDFAEKLNESFIYSNENYYKGVGAKDVLHDVCQLISACVFVNANYLDFLNNFNPLFENCIFIGNEWGNKEALPFKPERYVKIKENAWKDLNSNLLDLYMIRFLEKQQNKIVLVAGGPMANTLIHKLYTSNQNNTYINVGSTYDFWLFGKITRQYQKRLFNEK